MPNPPSPSPPSPPPPCPTCLEITLESMLPVPPKAAFEFTEEQCLFIQSRIASEVPAQIAALGLHPMLVNFTANTRLCEPGEINVCGTFYSKQDAKQLEPWMGLQAKFWLQYLAGDCNAVTAGYNFRIKSNPNDCLDVDAGWTCAPENTTFPPCQ
ncbi:hypothetical protein PLESTB_001652600 [Pleodorina starrii]|uniref:Uncharacterized protein n=1 Tax=Pleodorina starrii TaxID=330485 RepID=A0A9W6BYL0_9CHLO|nr:hypothetical protein PLESTB_001652600 [Pleodorina starrii]